MTDEIVPLVASARLFGRLLVRELDVDTLGELARPGLRRALADVGVDVPGPERLDDLAHEWLACFLHPEHTAPPVHSLFRDGGYSGDAAVAVREIARAAGLELAPGARNAPPDHIGCVLLLWAELAGRRPDLAALLAEQHMSWAERALQPTASRGRDFPFYGPVAGAAVALLRELRQALPPQRRASG